MCGILFYYFLLKAVPDSMKHRIDYESLKKETARLSSTLKHRGPDDSGVTIIQENDASICMGHERLSIVDLTDAGHQPLFNEDNSISLIANGEIYNHEEIQSRLTNPPYKHQFKGHSDSESIIHLYEEVGAEECVKQLDGIFAFILYDSKKRKIFVARDPIGIKPLFVGKRHNDHSIWFSSEMKVLVKAKCDIIQLFPPGHYSYVDLDDPYPVQIGGEFDKEHNKSAELVPIIHAKRYYNPTWFKVPKDLSVYDRSDETDLKLLKDTFTKAVEKRVLSTDVPVGVFLSGGLDSSLVAALSMNTIKNHPKSKQNELHSFSIGIGNNQSPDLIAAKKVAEFIGTTHHERVFTIEEGIAALRKVIYHIESYDITTVRASTPMVLLSELASQYVKVVLSGEGSDEMFAGYVYFKDADTPYMLQKELVRKVRDLHYADVLRCDRSTSAHGIEARVPFLDKEFLNVSMTIHAKKKMFGYNIYGDEKSQQFKSMEKHIVREAFDKDNVLPQDMLWRVKEQFSDGVGYSWIDKLIEHCEKQVSDEQFSKRFDMFPYNTPKTKEAFFYRTIFEEFYPLKSCIHQIKKWLPWSNFDVDPSGRFQREYKTPTQVIEEETD